MFIAASKLSRPQSENYEEFTIRSKIGKSPLFLHAALANLLPGNLLRDPSVHDPLTDTHWSVSLLFSCMLDILPIYKTTGHLQGKTMPFPSQTRAAHSYHLTDPAIMDVISKYNAFVTLIEQLGLPRAIEQKPRLDVGHS